MKNYRAQVSERLDIPGEAAGLLKLTVSGRGRALVENHRGLLEYAGERIEINGGSVRLRLSGEGLTLAAMDREALLITGSIAAIEYE